MRPVLAVVILLHGLVHLLGFVKAFNLGPFAQLLKQDITPVNGSLWLVATLLFALSSVLYFFGKEQWWMYCFTGILISQYLVFTSWTDASWGTIANIIMLLACITGYATWSYSAKYKRDVVLNIKHQSDIHADLTDADIQDLPEPVRRYIRYSGSLGKPKVYNFRIEFTGGIRKDEASEWMPFSSEQYNFMDKPTRLFFMKAVMKHLPVAGFHSFRNGDAFMDIRLLSMFTVQYQDGKEMGIAETVTFFNDMCCMAPATLIDKRIKWLQTDGNKVLAEFTNNGKTITAWLHFNDKGELVNFISGDRYAAGDKGTMQKLTWATPLTKYKEINGRHLAGYAEAIYSYPSGDLCYGTFRLKRIQYNCRDLN